MTKIAKKCLFYLALTLLSASFAQSGDLFFTYYNNWCMGSDANWSFGQAYYISTKTFAKNIGNITHVVVFMGYEIVKDDHVPYFSVTKQYADNGGSSQDSIDLLWNGGGNPGGGYSDWVNRGGIEALRDSLHAKGKFILIDLQAVNASVGLNTVVADSVKTEVFSKAVWAYMVRHNFDGADLNVENSQTYTQAQFLRFHRIMARNKPAGKLYTVVPPITQEADYAGAQSYIDYVIPQHYAYVSNWDPNIGANSIFLKAPLYLNTIPANSEHRSIATPNPKLSDEAWGPKRWLNAGWPKSKIVILLSNEANPFTGSDQLFSNAGWNTPFWPDTAAYNMKLHGGTEHWSADIGTYISGTATASVSSNGTTIPSGSQFIVPVLSDRNIDSVVAWGKANGYNNYGLYDVSTDARTPDAVKMPRHAHLGSRLNANGGPVPTGTLSASPSSVPVGGGSVTLTWSSSNAQSASIDQGIGTVSLNGSRVITVTATTTFTCTLTNTYGSSWYSTTVTVETPPPVPVLATPVNASTGIATSPTLTWNASSGATSYHLQVSTSSAFTTTVVDQTNIIATSYALAALTANTNYYWRVSAVNTVGASAYPTAWSFTTRAAPTGTDITQSGTTIAAIPSPTGAGGPITVINDGNMPATTSTDATTQFDTFTGITNGTFDWVGYQFPTAHNFTTILYQEGLDDNQWGGWFTSLKVQALVNGTWTDVQNLVSAPPYAGHNGVNYEQYQLTFTPVVATAIRLAGTPGGQNTYIGVGELRAFSSDIVTPPPPVPVPLSPLNSSTGQPATITVSWNTATGATSYRLQLSTDSLFSTTVVNDSTVTGTSRQVGPLANATRYFWRVNAKNAGGTSAYSTVWNFTTMVAPPTAPTLAAPANRSTNQATTLNLGWNAPSGATSCRLQLSTDSLFALTILDDSTVTGTTRQVGPLSNATKYFWRMNAKNSAGTSGYSAVWSFTTVPAVPGVPTLAAPANGAAGQATTLSLSWNASSGATSYRLQLSTDSLFATTLVNDSTITGTTRQVGPLSNVTAYFWRVNAKNTGGTSAFSGVWKFTTTVAPPPVPTLAAPTNGAINQPTGLSLGWNAASGATSYRLQLSTDSLFASSIVDDSSITGTSRQVGPLSNATKYFWRVNAKNVGGASAYSVVRNFTTLPAPPAVPVLAAPASGATNQATTLNLSWSASAGATSYRLQLSTDSLFASTVVNDSTVTAPSRQVGPLSDATKYFWRVNAKNAGGTSAYSAVWGFTTNAAVPAAPALVAPANGATDQATTLSLSWNASTGATSYRLQLAADSLFASMLVNDSTVTGTSRQVGPLSNAAKHFWRVSARNGAVAGAYSMVRSFTTIPSAPSAPTLVSPGVSKTGQPTTLTLVWNASTGATTYRLQVSGDSTFALTTVDDSTVTSTSRQVGPLAVNATYYWHVRAQNSGGTSGYSSIWSFVTADTAAQVLAAPAPAAPTSGTTIQPTNTTVSWNPSQGAAAYRLQVSLDSLFGSSVLDDSTITTTSRQISLTKSRSKYFWHVRAEKGTMRSSYSAAWSIITTVNRPAPPKLHQPPKGSKQSASLLTLTWDPSIDALKYRVQVAIEPLFSWVWIDNTEVTGTTYDISGMIASTAYYWRVQASNEAGTSDWSEVWDFETAPATSVTDTLSLPVAFSLQQNYPNPFNPTTRINFNLPTSGKVLLVVHNLLGQPVATLVDEHLQAGVHSVAFKGDQLPSGVYIYSIRVGNFKDVKRMLLLR